MNIYAQNILQLTKYAIVCLIAWLCIINYFSGRHKKNLRIVCVLLSAIALYGILTYTVLGRTPTNEHIYTFSAQYTNEYHREMFMNVLLYLPFGMAVSVLVGPWTVLLGLFISAAIEYWQYSAGTGLAQGTDVIMNTAGAAIGSLPALISWLLHRRKKT